MANDASRCFWVTEVVSIRPDGDCMRVELKDDFGTVVIRMSLATLVIGHNRAKSAIKLRTDAEVLPLPKHG